MSETIGDRFKAAFITNRKLGKKLRERHAATLADVETARSVAETLPDDQYDAALKRLDDLEGRITNTVVAGTNNPGKAWAEMGPLQQEAAKLKSEWLGRDPKADKADPAKRFNRSLRPTFGALQEARSGTRDIADEAVAGQFQRRIAVLGEHVEGLFNAVKTAGGKPTALDCEKLEAYRETAGELVRDVRRAQGLPATPGTERATSRATVDAVMTKVAVIGARMNATTTDPQGRTPLQELRGRLEVFDDRFAADPDASPDAAKQNTAMRLAAIAAVTSRGLAGSVNDPNLEPRLAQSLIAEYAGDMTEALAPDDDDTEMQEAVALAQALVMDDPLTKLMTGKINPADAVQRIRDMATAGGVQPSVMMKLLRQQFDMKIGSLTYSEVSRGEKQRDPGAQGNFDLDELTGELSKGQFLGMVDHRHSGGPDERNDDTGAPKWQDDGSGLKLKPAKKQLHEVKAGDTLSSLAATYLGDPARWQTIRDSNKVVVMPDGSQVAVKDLADTAPLPVGATLTVPGKQSLLEQLAPYVAAWDEDDTDEDESGEDEPEDGYEADVEPPDQRDPQPPKLSRRRKKELRLAEAERFKDNPRREITPDALLKGAANLRSPGDTDPEYISAPGLGQSHKVREPLGSDQTEQGKSRRDLEKLSDAENEKLRQKHIDDEADKQYGALSQRQYAHLRMLARADEDEQEAVLAREGKPLDDVIAEKISKRYGPDRVDDARARDIAKQVEAWIAKVPLTITFTADRLFSDPTKNEPKYGSKYASEVTFSRGQEKLGDLIGRDDLHDDTAKVGTTGGTKTGWEERGDNYMRWRRDKDDREGRHDELSYEDQQIFGAANPAFDKAKGGVGKDYGSNYYGSAHFLLNDAVRNRCAFIVRAATGGTDETRAPVQRKNIGMLIYDMLTTTSGNAQFLDAILQNKSGSAKAIAPGLNWEVHLYGGFDIGKDVDTIYLPSDLDKAVARRIRAFARNHGIACAKIGAKPDGLDVLPEMNPKQVELPADDGASEEED